MGRGFDIPWVWGVIQNTIGRWFDIPWVWGVIQNRIGRWFDLSLGGYSIYHGLRGSYKIL
jgi:hypothetical protein